MVESTSKSYVMSFEDVNWFRKSVIEVKHRAMMVRNCICPPNVFSTVPRKTGVKKDEMNVMVQDAKNHRLKVILCQNKATSRLMMFYIVSTCNGVVN